MTIKNNFRIVFLETLAAQKKIEWLTKIGQLHFDQKQPIHFYTDSQAGVDFIDKVLWSTPPMSFLPHSTNGDALITIGSEWREDQTVIFNLTAEMLTPTSLTSTIYEFDDQTHPNKRELSRKKYSYYKQNGFHIINQ